MSYQFIRLRGVVDDGSSFGIDVPRNTATTFLIPQSGSVNVDVEVTYNSGVPVLLAELSGAAGTLSAQQDISMCQTIPALRVSGVVLSDNVLRFAIPASATKRLEPGRYFFDVWLTSGTNRWQIVKVGVMILQVSLSRG